MTDASMLVARKETPPMVKTSGGPSGRKTAEDSSKPERRSFSDTLKKAESGAVARPVGEPGEKPSTRSEKAVHSGDGERSFTTKTAEKTGDKKPAAKIRNAAQLLRNGAVLKTDTERSAETPDDVSAENVPRSAGNGLRELVAGGSTEAGRETATNTEQHLSEDGVVQVAVVSGEPNRHRVRTPDDDSVQKAGIRTDGIKSENREKHRSGSRITEQNVNLSGKSGKVEVEDRRDPVIADRKIHAGNRHMPSRAADSHSAPETVEARTEGFRVDVPAAENEIEIEIPGSKPGESRSAAAELSRKLDAQAGSDIVRQVKVVLNRADAGEVRINLRPDNLGRVRVRIQMEDNKLTGRIYVESAAAREAFRSALDGLQTRLVESGFGSADLELAWDDGSGSFAGGEQKNREGTLPSGQAVKEFENMVPTSVIDEAAGETRVNMVV